MKILKLIAQCLIFSICVSILVAELCLIKARKERVGTLSYSQEYTLIPLNDVNKEFDTAIVVETDMGTEILYSIPRCFPSRGAFHAAWANENNDFFVCLRAIGVYLYMYNDDKSWTEFRIERINDEENERYIIYETENKYGELYPKYRCLYKYDFRPDGELALITFPSNATRTICEKAGNVKAFLTYQRYNGSKEIVDVTLTKYGDHGLLETMIQVALFDNAKSIAEVYVEMYGPIISKERTCNRFLILLTDESRHNYGCFEDTYRVFYNDNLKIIDYEWLTNDNKSVQQMTF